MTKFQELFSFLNSTKVIKTFGRSLKISTFKQLIRGYDSNRKASDFSESQKKELLDILEKVATHILQFIKENKK